MVRKTQHMNNSLTITKMSGTMHLLVYYILNQKEGIYMKRICLIVLSLLLCLSLCACDKDSQNGGQFGGSQNEPNENTVQLGGNDDLREKPLIIYSEGGKPYINTERFPECIETIVLTTENWKEYLKDYSYSYDEVKVEKNAFGEVVSTETVTHTGRLLGADNERIHSFVDVAIELKNKATGELKTFSFSFCGCPIGGEMQIPTNGSWYQGIPDDFSFDNYECTRIKGRLYYFNLPIDELPVSTQIWPWYEEGMIPLPGAMWIYPGTNGIEYGNIEYWLS